MLAIAGQDIIVRAQGRDSANSYSFLADVQVAEAANFSKAV